MINWLFLWAYKKTVGIVRDKLMKIKQVKTILIKYAHINKKQLEDKNN